MLQSLLSRGSIFDFEIDFEIPLPGIQVCNIPGDGLSGLDADKLPTSFRTPDNDKPYPRRTSPFFQLASSSSFASSASS